MKLAILSHFGTKNKISNHVKVYLNELSIYFDKIILVTNNRNLHVDEILLLESNAVILIFTQNKGFDFGMWSRVVSNLNLIEYSFLCLCNDSCYPVNSIQAVLSEHNNNQYDICSLTDSYEIDYHLQSYFLTFKMKGIPFINNFLKGCNSHMSKNEVIKNCEVELSKEALKQKLSIKATFPSSAWGCFDKNPCYTLWKENLLIGCPLIKKRLILNSFTPLEKIHYQNSLDLCFNYKKYLSHFIKNSSWNVDPNYLFES